MNLGNTGASAGLNHRLADIGHAKAHTILEELHEDLPIMQRAGFSLASLEVELGMTPALTPRFHVDREITKEEQTTILAETKAKPMLHTILSLLFKSRHLSSAFTVGDLEFHSFKIELGTIPKIGLLFTPEGRIQPETDADEGAG